MKVSGVFPNLTQFKVKIKEEPAAEIKLEPGEDVLVKEEDYVPVAPKRRGRPKKDLINQLTSPNFCIFENQVVPKLQRSRSIGSVPSNISRYEFGKIISSGMIGVVYLARDMHQPFYP